jgi:phytoene dehydrogenase-like protein
MRQTLAARAPEWADGVQQCMTASPRTWQRFTGRPAGKVGGAPRRAGWHNYLDLAPQQATRGLWLVGDSVFPGQSALATALGGQRAATAALNWLGKPR